MANMMKLLAFTACVVAVAALTASEEKQLAEVDFVCPEDCYVQQCDACEQHCLGQGMWPVSLSSCSAHVSESVRTTIGSPVEEGCNCVDPRKARELRQLLGYEDLDMAPAPAPAAEY